jgi:hypothetical protein
MQALLSTPAQVLSFMSFPLKYKLNNHHQITAFITEQLDTTSSSMQLGLHH